METVQTLLSNLWSRWCPFWCPVEPSICDRMPQLLQGTCEQLSGLAESSPYALAASAVGGAALMGAGVYYNCSRSKKEITSSDLILDAVVVVSNTPEEQAVQADEVTPTEQAPQRTAREKAAYLNAMAHYSQYGGTKPTL